MPDTCPRCGSDELLGKKFGMGGFSIIERKCWSCGLFEYKSTADADFTDWYSRWSTDDEDVPSPDMGPVVAAPDDDRPRLTYAQAIERRRPERAELIRLQIERFADERARGVEIDRPSPREKELLEKHADDWAQSGVGMSPMTLFRISEGTPRAYGAALRRARVNATRSGPLKEAVKAEGIGCPVAPYRLGPCRETNRLTASDVPYRNQRVARRNPVIR